MVHFYSGSVTPAEGETVTGASSGDTGTLARYVLISGTAAGGDAVGVMEFTSPTGYDLGNLEIFEKDELLNGSVSGDNFATATNKGAIQVSGRLIPEQDLVEYRGKKYCRAHFRFTYENDWKDEAGVNDDENDREV